MQTCPACGHRLDLVQGDDDDPQNCVDYWYCPRCDGVFDVDDADPNEWQPSDAADAEGGA